MCDWDRSDDAVLHATLLAESGRTELYAAVRPLEPIPDDVAERIRTRVLSKVKGDAMEAAARKVAE
jgi:hypothetical protein